LPAGLNFEGTSGMPDQRISAFLSLTFSISIVRFLDSLPLLTSAGIGMMERTTAQRTIRHWFVPHSWLFFRDQSDAA
jgi:hypothetical protein